MQAPLVFAFEPQQCRQIALSLSHLGWEKLDLFSRELSIRKFVATLDLGRPIVGLGIKRSQKADFVVERSFTNSFRTKIISAAGNARHRQNALVGVPQGKDAGNSYCNLVSYLLLERAQREAVSLQYAFVHIGAAEIGVGLVCKQLHEVLLPQLISA